MYFLLAILYFYFALDFVALHMFVENKTFTYRFYCLVKILVDLNNYLKIKKKEILKSIN